MQTNSFALVFIHGHGVDASIWDGIYADLVSGASVIKPDFSRSTTHTTVEAYAEELYAQLQVVQADKVVLIGHSMGGYIALAFADQHPELVQGLVLYHSTTTADDNDRREIRRQVIEGLKSAGTVPFIRKQIPKMVAPSYPSEKVQLLIDHYQNLPADGLSAGMTAIANRHDRTHVLRNTQFPVLLVLGRDDQVLPYEKTAQLADLSPRVSLATIEQAGHLSMVEQPGQAIHVLRSFLDRL